MTVSILTKAIANDPIGTNAVDIVVGTTTRGLNDRFPALATNL